MANRSGARTSGNVSTPPLPSLTSSNTSAGSDAKSPHHRNNTIPRYSSRDMSSSGNASNMTSPVGTGDENTLERDRRHSWHEIQEEINSQSRYSPRNISVARHNPRTGHTETILMENQPNGDSGKIINKIKQVIQLLICNSLDLRACIHARLIRSPSIKSPSNDPKTWYILLITPQY